jgi:hypothetical protein
MTDDRDAANPEFVGHRSSVFLSTVFVSPLALRDCAMKSGTALVLRLVGPLIELPCALGVMYFWNRGVRLLGIPVEYAFVVGLVVGLCMVIAGLTLVKRVRPSRPSRWD